MYGQTWYCYPIALQNFAKIEFAKTDANTYVYMMTLNDKSKFVDIRRYDSNEFKEVLNLLPNGIVQLIEIYADNRKQFKKDKLGKALYHCYQLAIQDDESF